VFRCDSKAGWFRRDAEHAAAVRPDIWTEPRWSRLRIPAAERLRIDRYDGAATDQLQQDHRRVLTAFQATMQCRGMHSDDACRE